MLLKIGFREVTGSTLTERETNELMAELGDKKSGSIDYTSELFLLLCRKMI